MRVHSFGDCEPRNGVDSGFSGGSSDRAGRAPRPAAAAGEITAIGGRRPAIRLPEQAVRTVGASEDVVWPTACARRSFAPPLDCYNPRPADAYVSARFRVMKTYSAKPHEIEHDWYVVDAEGRNLGRLACALPTHCAARTSPVHASRRYRRLRRGSQRREDRGNRQQARQEDLLPALRLPGRPARAHATRAARAEATEVLRKAVKGMLPRNRLAAPRSASSRSTRAPSIRTARSSRNNSNSRTRI